MRTKFKNLRNDLENLEDTGRFGLEHSGEEQSKSSSRLANYILLIAFITTLIFYAGSKVNFSELELNPIENIVQELNEPDVNLLNRMGAWMEEMGYGVLSHEELIELRENDVTATYTSQIRGLGYTDVTLEQLVDLQQADVSATFARMMKELGYELSLEDLMTLRRNDVTAYFTSNMLDLGYTMEELTKENLSRLRSIGVTHSLVENLIETQQTKPTVEELIRYRISNQ